MASQPESRDDKQAPVPLGGTRSEAVQRLQVGLSLLAGVLLLVGLANVIEDRAKETDAAAVPEAAATVTPSPSSAPKKDPLADAGVVPDLPAAPQPSPSVEPLDVPRQGDATPQQ